MNILESNFREMHVLWSLKMFALTYVSPKAELDKNSCAEIVIPGNRNKGLGGAR